MLHDEAFSEPSRVGYDFWIGATDVLQLLNLFGACVPATLARAGYTMCSQHP